MTSDVTLAFGPPEMRAAATAPLGMADRISLRDHVVTVEIGAFQQERGTRQRLRFNLVVEVAPHDGAASDDVDRILSYDTLTEAIAAELAAERLNLLETLADRIAARVLRRPQALRCFVRIEKLDRGPGDLGVEIARARPAVPGEAEPAPGQPAARVVYLANAALDSPHLARWIDSLDRQEMPAILCVGLPDIPRPNAASPLAQRRIDLLAIEQNAWILAARDRRCMVVASRTEMDWALSHGHLTVWAPSKMVLDAADPAVVAAGENHGPDLAGWLAARIGASGLLVIGDRPPGGTAVPVQSHDIATPTLPGA